MMKKPMLADNKGWNPKLVEANLPLLGLVKLDGIRMLVDNGVGYSRSLKPLPNKQLQAKVAKYAKELQGFDGEIIVGDPTDEFCYKNSHRACMKGDLEADHHFYVFDSWELSDWEFYERIDSVQELLLNVPVPWASALSYVELEKMNQVTNFININLSLGHEGSILRRADRLYKNGRATAKSGAMFKHKSRIDTEVTITEIIELMVNNNPKTVNELGNSVRSSHKENLVPGGTMGSFSCSGFFEDGTPFTTNVGVFKGFTKEDKQKIWDNRGKFIGSIMKIKYMGVGSDLAPRTPVALGFRDPIDMS